MPDLSTLDSMIWVDYAISFVVMISSLSGLRRGFVKEAFSLSTWLVAFGLANFYARDYAGLFQGTINNAAAQIAAAFIAVLLATLMLGSLISFILKQLIENAGLTATDRFWGLLFGLIRGGVLVLVIVLLAGLTPLPRDSWWQQSVLVPPFQTFAIWLKDHIPSTLTGYINFR